MAEITLQNARRKIDEAAELCAASIAPSLSGRGIVICGGGLRYFTCAWVCINILRYLGCKLPIQLWHLGPGEMPESLRKLLCPLNVQCVDAREVALSNPVRTLNGWELKCFAIQNSPFQEVILLDADNVPIVDPEFLFETPQYRESGAVFWPDFGRLSASRAIWRLTGIPYQNEPEFESGQIIIDKLRCWQPLKLAMWMNEHSDFWYKHIHGDKETFHMAWRKLKKQYSMPDRGIQALKGTMCQHDFSGRRIFQHRNMGKWTLGQNIHVPGFEMERLCLGYLNQLEAYRRELRGLPSFDPELGAPLAGKSINYRRIGFDIRAMALMPNGDIGKGCDRMERYWGIRQQSDVPVLELYGDDGLTARLKSESRTNSLWKGQWLIHERMPVEIQVISDA